MGRLQAHLTKMRENRSVRAQWKEIGIENGLSDEDLEVWVNIMDELGKRFSDYETWTRESIQRIWNSEKPDLEPVLLQIKEGDGKEYIRRSKNMKEYLRCSYPNRYLKYIVMESITESTIPWEEVKC